MRREAQPLLSEDGQQALDQYAQVLQHLEDLSPVTWRNYLSDLRQFIAWCERSWRDTQEDRTFTPQAIAPALLVRYRDHLQTTLGLKPATINRTLMSLKRYFAWTRKAQLIQSNPASLIKFVPKEASSPRHLDDDEEDALVAAVNATGTLRITGKRKKVREVPLNTTARSILSRYLETLLQERQYLFPSEKTRKALTGRVLGHLVTKYAAQARIVDVSPHDLRHRFGYRMAEVVPLHRLAQIMGHDSLDTTMLYMQGTKQDLQHDVERIAWT